MFVLYNRLKKVTILSIHIFVVVICLFVNEMLVFLCAIIFSVFRFLFSGSEK